MFPRATIMFITLISLSAVAFAQQSPPAPEAPPPFSGKFYEQCERIVAQYRNVPEVASVLEATPTYRICGCVYQETSQDPRLHPLFALGADELNRRLASQPLETYAVAKTTSLIFSCLSNAIDAALVNSGKMK